MDEHGTIDELGRHCEMFRDALEELSQSDLYWQYVEWFSRSPEFTATRKELIDRIVAEWRRRATL